ncbi:RNA polymerase recycling motor HelD [Paenibacillus sp. GD4]|uniref:RNA polymerase recycling motor HelD n=1 Tax=Paenibacillus sp. GD4 TaxID=3068890 RepID=UPI0027968A5E|nr:RNA polymerase recycling motor HelD [Paenibacillus sp. GD4]MDQ1911207.1 RNA polymerase recycling motor HelD [Paenibacillus sp. GD4]
MIQDADWQEERKRLKLVLREVKKILDKTEDLSDQRKSTVFEALKDFWEDISVNMANPDDIMETVTSITQQQMMLAGQERSLMHAEATRHRVVRMYRTPYFGRIDFTEEGTNDREQIYIGIASVLNEETQEYLVYDWRAPISNLFYDYPPGPASYETPSGTISGMLNLKRQYVIRNGELQAMFDTGVTIGDEVLQHLLGQSADDRMKSIVATIQKEQNQIIRDDKHQVLIVQGSAGSGKTSVALQRIAYLLYKHRNTLNADNVVLFSPNTLFNSYVSSVLPEMGEANMHQTTYQEYLQLRLGSRFDIEDPYSQMEYILTAPAGRELEVRRLSIRFKSSEAFLAIMDAYAARLEQERGMLFHDLTFQGRILISGKAIREQFYGMDPSLKITNRLGLLKDWLLKELKVAAKKERQADWVKDELELLDKEDYQRAYEAMRKVNDEREISFDDARLETQFLAKFIVHERFKPLRQTIRKLRFLSVTAMYEQLFTGSWLQEAAEQAGIGVPEGMDDVARFTLGKIQSGHLPYEDATPMLYLNELIEGFQSYNTVKHVFIDEAQDYTAFQYAFLGRLFPRSRLTLLGDFNQAIYAHASEQDGYNVLYRRYSPEQVRMIRLVRSYRSTEEIVAYSKAILPDGEPVEPFRRSGQPPKVTAASDTGALAAAIAEETGLLLAKGVTSIAIICKTAQEAAEAHELLKDFISVELITKESRDFHGGLLVIPVYLAKGLEFDAVLLFDAGENKYAKESERKLLYTACTRAMHHLSIFYTGEPSPFLPLAGNT